MKCSSSLHVLALASAIWISPATLFAGPHESPHWAYSGEAGPEHWGDLDSSYTACKTGKTQSPVDLKWQSPEGGRAIEFKYRPSPMRIVDNGHTVQVNFEPGSEIAIEGHSFELVQMHFHSGSEHTLSKKSFPLELHLVHKDGDGKLAVVGVMFKEGERNPALAGVWSNLPPKQGEEMAVNGVEIDPATFLPDKRTHYHYMGSLTTPPCTEGVNWNVMNTPMEASAEQIAAFRKMYAGNNRPIQPLFERKPANY